MNEYDDIENILMKCAVCYNRNIHDPQKRLHTCLDCTWHKWLSKHDEKTIDACIRARKLEPFYSACVEEDERKLTRKKSYVPDEGFY